jgi:hypothetical protein
MKRREPIQPPTQLDGPLSSELLLLPDGRVLAHHLTRPMAVLLRRLNPGDRQFTRRAAARARHLTPPAPRAHELPD